jgi:hypothetical protein
MSKRQYLKRGQQNYKKIEIIDPLNKFAVSIIVQLRILKNNHKIPSESKKPEIGRSMIMEQCCEGKLATNWGYESQSKSFHTHV